MLIITWQIGAARSLVGWEQHQLATNAGVAVSTMAEKVLEHNLLHY